MKLLAKFILTVLILYLFSMFLFSFFQEKIIFQPQKLEPNYSFSFQQNFEEINLKTIDSSNINALLFKVKNPKGVILYFHGNKGNLVRWGEITSYFTKFDYDVFVMDYRSYGKSTGKYDENLMYNDAQICYNYLKEIYTEDKIIIYGRSLGGTFAVKTAALNQPKQLILEAPFFNLKDVAKYHYPFISFKFLMKYKFSSDKFISKVNCNTTIFHGTVDKVVPYSSGEKLFEKSNKKQTSFIAIENGTHHNLVEFEKYQETIDLLLK